MKDLFDGISGIWRGEYVHDHKYSDYRPTKAIPFILRIKQAGLLGTKAGFQGICQDDPLITGIASHSKVYGTIEAKSIFFVKLYPTTHAYDQHGNLMTGDDAHPEIVYEGSQSDSNIFHGLWKMDKTIRMVNGNLAILNAMTGHWWMKKME